MCDHEGGATFHHLFERGLHLGLGCGVEGAGGFVEDQDRRILQQRARDRHALTLAAGERAATFADAGLQTFGLVLDEIEGLGALACRTQLLVGRVRLSDPEILRNRTVEQQDLLKDDADVAAEGRELQAADVHAGEERIGALTVDDEDGDRSYNFEVKISLGEAADVKNLKTLEAYLRRKFDNDRIRVVARPRKKDSAEVYVGEEYIGVLFFDEKETRSCYFEMAILDMDLEDTKLS
jgi:hypothetical protein